MLLDCYHNPNKISQKYFIECAKRWRDYHNDSNIFGVSKNCKIYTHGYKIPSVYGARKSYSVVREILKLAKTNFCYGYERNAYNEHFKLTVAEPYKIPSKNVVIVILSRMSLSKKEHNFILEFVRNKKFLKDKHIKIICDKLCFNNH